MSSLLYDVNKWKELKDYYIYDVPQRDPSWLLVKIGRPSGSTIGYLLGHSIFNTVDEAVLDICCMKYNIQNSVLNTINPIILGKKEKNENAIRVMGLGTVNEPIAREYYATKEYYANAREVKCEEVGYAVPKFDTRLGVSIDGDVTNMDDSETNGIVEIKCPEKMYNPIKNYLVTKSFISKHQGTVIKRNSEKAEWKPKTYKDDYYYIWQTHYDQMQLGMAVMQKTWCDYIVYALDGNRFIKRVYFDKNYWNNMLLEIDTVLKNKINPLLNYLNITKCEDILKYGLKLSNYTDYGNQILEFPLMPSI